MECVTDYAIFFLDPSGHVAAWNAGAERILGYRESDAVGEPFSRFFTPEDIQSGQPDKELQTATRTGRANDDRWLGRRDGTRLWCSGVTTALRDEEGRLGGFAKVVQDISERRRGDETGLRLAAIVESSDDAIISKNLDGIIVSWNKAAERLYGYTAEEIVGKPLARLVPPDHPDELPAIMARLRRGERIEHFETVRVRKDGSRVDVSLTISPVKGADGKIIGASKIARDITARKQVEEALRRSEVQFRQLADAMPQIGWTARPDGYLDYYNERWYEYTGFPRGEYGQQSWEPVLHPDDVQRCVDTYFGCIKAEKPYQIEYRFKDRRAGGYRWFLGRAVPVRDEQGRTVRWFGTCTDIDDTKRAEEALKEADRRKEELLAMLAHELRNPLAPIRNALHVVQMRGQERRQAVREAWEMIERQVETLVRLVDDLLDVSRISRGKINLQKEP